MDQISIPYRIRQSFEALGLEPAKVLQQARLPQNLLQQERLVVTAAQWLALGMPLRASTTIRRLGCIFGVSWKAGHTIHS